MNLNLTGYKALVCGSTQGIGKASAIELAKLGANVTLLARNKETLKEVCNALPNNGEQNHSYLVADFSKKYELLSVLETTNEFHILVNNTGGPAGGLIKEAKLNEFTTAFSNHLLCNHILVQALVPFMKSEGYGRIINIISTSVKAPIPGLGVSNTIRGAVASWSKTLSAELASLGITVNNVLPGLTSTGRLQSIIESKAQQLSVTKDDVIAAMKKEIPASRFAKPEEVATAVAFLACPAASYINGVNLPVDGGKTMCL